MVAAGHCCAIALRADVFAAFSPKLLQKLLLFGEIPRWAIFEIIGNLPKLL